MAKGNLQIKSKEGSQPWPREVAFQIGKTCPVGMEPVLLAGLDKLWPNLPREEAVNSFLNGLASRFEKKSNG